MNIVTEKIRKPSSIKNSAPTNEEVGLAKSQAYPPLTLPVTLPMAVKIDPLSPYSTQTCALGIYLINQGITAS